jgi:endonuclease/exonuclease/phosphatase family metal-dependent hydrolase
MKLKRLVSILSLLLATLTVLSLWGCDSTPAPAPSIPTNPPTTTATPDDDATVTTGPQTEDEDAEFTVEHLKQAKIIYPDIETNGTYIVEVARVLQTMIKEKYGVEVPVFTDKILEGHTSYKEVKYEILIGDTNRKESEMLFTDLLLNDYGYALCGTKILIKGGGDDALQKAINEFKNKIVIPKKGGRTVFYKPEFDFVLRNNYVAKDATLNGAPISKFSIVYPANATQFEARLARRLADNLTLLSGYKFEYTTDAKAPGEYEILLGKTNRSFSLQTTTGAAVEAGEKTIAIVGSNAYEYGLAQQKLVDMITSVVGQQKTAVTIPAVTAVPRNARISMMAYNVYGFEVYAERCDNIKTLIVKYLPDIIAYQEPAMDMMAYLTMDEYYQCEVGIPRYTASVPPQNTGYGGANSVAAILFAKDRYEMLDKGTKWMTGTPDTFSKLEGSNHYRIYSYVVLRDKQTNLEFIVVNHHLDFDDAIQQTTMRYMFKYFQENYTDIPVVMLGDFNATENSSVIKDLVVGSAGFTSLKHLSTSHGATSNVATIDYIFGMSCCVTGLYHTTCVETYRDLSGKYGKKYDGIKPSDHPAVYAEMMISYDGHTHDWSEAASGVYWANEAH